MPFQGSCWLGDPLVQALTLTLVRTSHARSAKSHASERLVGGLSGGERDRDVMVSHKPVGTRALLHSKCMCSERQIIGAGVCYKGRK